MSQNYENFRHEKFKPLCGKTSPPKVVKPSAAITPMIIQ
jgi:hypothetical protein